MKVLKSTLSVIAYLFLGYWIIAWLWPCLVWLAEGHIYYFNEIFVGVCNFISQLIVFYIGWDRHVRRLERERGAKNIVWEAGKGADLIACALVAFCAASTVTLILLLSWLIGIKIDIPLWFLIAYAFLTGTGYAGVINYQVYIHKGDAGSDNKLFLFIFPILVALSLHIIDFFL